MEALINTIIDTALLYYENTHSSSAASLSNDASEKTNINLITDFIFLGLGNYVLSKIADPSTPQEGGLGLSNRLHTTLKASYYPVSSGLFFSAYSNMMYNNSYVRSLTISAPLMIGETYLNTRIIESKKEKTLDTTRSYFKTHTLLGSHSSTLSSLST